MQGPLHQLLEDFRGRVRLVYIHTPISPRSTRAAEAGECAYRQGRFWEYKDKVFDMQHEWTRAPDWEEQLIAYGRDAGLDMASFKGCLESGEYRNAVRADIQAGQTYKIKYTPTIILSDGSRFVGPDIEPVRKALEGTLKLRGGE